MTPPPEVHSLPSNSHNSFQLILFFDGLPLGSVLSGRAHPDSEFPRPPFSASFAGSRPVFRDASTRLAASLDLGGVQTLLDLTLTSPIRLDSRHMGAWRHRGG